jgi:hypothetical protein
MFSWRRREPDNRWWRLATYNAEVARGILHTEEWKERMRREQDIFDAEQRRTVNVAPPPPPMPAVPIEPGRWP